MYIHAHKHLTGSLEYPSEYSRHLIYLLHSFHWWPNSLFWLMISCFPVKIRMSLEEQIPEVLPGIYISANDSQIYNSLEQVFLPMPYLINNSNFSSTVFFSPLNSVTSQYYSTYFIQQLFHTLSRLRLLEERYHALLNHIFPVLLLCYVYYK